MLFFIIFGILNIIGKNYLISALFLKYILIYKYNYLNNYKLPDKPYKFINTKLESNLVDIINEVNELLPQLSDFIDKFNSLVIDKNINVVTDSMGNMSIDVPQNISDNEAQDISKKINIIDRLVTTQGQSINSLLQKGLSIEEELKKTNPNYSSQLSKQVAQFKELNESYKH